MTKIDASKITQTMCDVIQGRPQIVKITSILLIKVITLVIYEQL